MAAGVWLRLRGWVRQLFGLTPQQSDDALMAAEMDAQRYFDNTAENITALVANTLATLAFGDADITITDGKTANATANSERLELLEGLLERETTAAKRNVAAGLGVGMIVTIPYSVDNGMGRKIYTSTVTRDRVYITGVQGSDITQCVVLSDMFTSDDNRRYFRWTSYTVDGGVYTIRNKATTEGNEVSLSSVERWAGIPGEVRIAGVDKLPLGIFRCPTANRRPDDITGVPITFGCDATLRKIAQTLDDIETEFRNKKVRILADRTLLRNNYDDNGNLIRRDLDDSLFVKMGESDRLGLDIFDPALRESSYYFKLQQHFAFLEKEIGVSRGVLTDSETKNATATEIRRAMYQTFCMLDDVHREYERYLDQLMYGINVLCNFYGLASDTRYEIKYDWSYALLEDTSETFRQLMEAYSAGAERTAELRMFIHPDEDLDTAQAAVDEIKRGNMMLNDLLGASGNDQVPED